MFSWRTLCLLLLAAWLATAVAQQDITGTWEGELAIAPGTTLAVHFVLTRDADGSYSAVVTSPNPDGIQNVAASSTRFEQNRLTLAVDELAGSYEGVLADGVIAGEWIQESGRIPLELRPYQERTLSQEAIETLLGQWTGDIEAPQGEITVVFRFESNDDAGFQGFLDVPAQGANGIALANVAFADDGTLGVDVPQVRGRYEGSLEGGQFVGTWTQGPQSLPLTLSRGEYTPTVTALDLSAEDMERLAGAWKGQLGPLEVTVRFETADTGERVAFLDVPAQGASGVVVSEATLAGDALTLRIAAIAAEYRAALSGAEISGEWQQGPQTMPLTLMRE